MAGKRGCGPRAGHCAGEANHRAKLTADNVREIRRMYRAGEGTQKELAERFNISVSSIHYIIRGRTWKHATAESKDG